MNRLIILFILCFFISACEGEPTNKDEQARKAQKAAESINYTENAEIDNIKKRLDLTSSPSLLGYVAIINNVGQIAMYTPVKGKVTSGGKRLTTPNKVLYQDLLVPTPSDEGTWGSSNPYVYFWTPSGRYIQTSMNYLYSDQPFRLTEKPLVVFEEKPEVASLKK